MVSFLHVSEICLGCVIFLLIACDGFPSETSEENEHLLSPLSDLKACGLDISKITIVDKNSWPEEHYVKLTAHPDLAQEEVDCVAKVLVWQEIGLRSDNPTIDAMYREPWGREHKRFLFEFAASWLNENRPELSFPRYAPLRSSLTNYIREIERKCGVDPRLQSFVSEEQKLVRFPYLSPLESQDDREADECAGAAAWVGLDNTDVRITSDFPE